MSWDKSNGNTFSGSFDTAVENYNAQLRELDILRAQLNVLEGNKTTLLNRKRVHEDTLDRIPVGMELLQALYSKTSGPLIKACEDAMTDSVQVVIGDKSVIGIDADIQNNQIHAHIGTAQLLTDGTRVLRNIMDNEGGGLTNVVSTSLRAISIVRSGQRRFMVLDEPNFWLNPEQIPRFSRIIQDIVEKAGFQIILLTHHGIDTFSDMENVNMIKMVRQEHGVRVHATHEADFETPGILSEIRLKNFGRHPNLVIPLQKGLNIITGESNVGKSRIQAALRAVILGSGYAGDIYMKEADGFSVMEKSTEVKITFDGGKTIEWKRKKSGSPIESWSYDIPRTHPDYGFVEDGTPVIRGIVCSGRNGKDWVGLPEVMNIQEISGFWPALHIQKSTSFALDNTKALASLISVSRTSIKIKSMIDILSERKRSANLEVRRIDAELKEISQKIFNLKTLLPDFQNTLEETQRLYHAISSLMTQHKEMSGFIEKWNDINLIFTRQENLKKIALDIPEVPDIRVMTDFAITHSLLMLEEWKVSSLATLHSDIPEMEIQDYGSLHQKWNGLSRQFETQSRLNNIHVDIPDTSAVTELSGLVNILLRHDTLNLELWFSESLSSLALDVPEISGITTLRNVSEFYKRARLDEDFIVSLEREKKRYLEIPDISNAQKNIKDMMTLYNRGAGYCTMLNEQQKTRNILEEKVSDITHDIENIQKSFDICPLCGHENHIH